MRFLRSSRSYTLSTVAVLLTACGSHPVGLDAECTGDGGVLFGMTGTLESSETPFSPASAIAGCLRVATDAAAPGTESTDREDILGFLVTIGPESWSGDGFSLAGQAPPGLRGGGLRFSVDDAGTEVVIHFNDGGRPSQPSGHHLVFRTQTGSATRFVVLSGVSPYPELAAGTMTFTR